MKSKNKKVILTSLSSLILLGGTSNVLAAQSISNNSNSVILSTSVNSTNLSKNEIINFEYNWLSKNTKLNRKAILGIISAAQYESGNNPADNLNGHGILGWNGVASIVVDNSTNALQSQLHYLKATINLHGNELVTHLNKSKSVFDAALTFERNYEGNAGFHRGGRGEKVYQRHISDLKKAVSITESNFQATSSSIKASSCFTNTQSVAKSLVTYLTKSTKLNHSAILGVCAVALHESNLDPNFHNKDGYGLMVWKRKPVPMNGNHKMSPLEQQELYLKDTINPKLVNELNSQKDAVSAANVFANKYCYEKNNVNWNFYVNDLKGLVN